MKCSLCGLEFDDKRAASSCVGCAMSRGCSMVKCPGCGFEMAEEADWMKRLFGSGKKKLNGAVNAAAAPGLTDEAKKFDARVPLTELAANGVGEVAHIDTSDQAAMRKIIAMGLLPGTPLRVLRKRPAYLISSGRRTIAVDGEIASKIFIVAAATERDG